ncbi:MAG: FAD-dependent oxidoreductase [Promethearchaeota archaeon]
MNELKIDVYGANWCGDCRRAKKYLGEQKLHYEWHDIEKETEQAKEDYQYVLDANNEKYGRPKRKIPVVKIVIGDKETVLIEPSNSELAAVIGKVTSASKSFYDVVVVGGGPAGLTAALYLARDGYEVVVVEKSTIGGNAYITNRIDNFPGFPDGISGSDFAENLRKQVTRFGVEIITPFEVKEIGPCHEEGVFEKCPAKRIVLNNGKELQARVVLIATGSKYRQLTNVPGFKELNGINIHYCATCDGAFYKGKEIFVIGGGNSAFEEGLYLKEKFARKVTFVVMEADPIASKILKEKVAGTAGIEVWTESQVVEVRGKDAIESVLVFHKNRDEKVEYHPDGIFVFIGLKPNTDFLPEAIEKDKFGFILASDAFHTTVKGIFAAGDCRSGSTKQAIASAGEGAGAAIMARNYLEGNL